MSTGFRNTQGCMYSPRTRSRYSVDRSRTMTEAPAVASTGGERAAGDAASDHDNVYASLMFGSWPAGRASGGVDVVIEAEKVVGVVVSLDLDEPLVVAAVSLAYEAGVIG